MQQTIQKRSDSNLSVFVSCIPLKSYCASVVNENSLDVAVLFDASADATR